MAESDAAAKRREARQRRILQNSESRMKKVMGLESSQGNEAPEPVSAKSENKSAEIQNEPCNIADQSQIEENAENQFGNSEPAKLSNEKTDDEVFNNGPRIKKEPYIEGAPAPFSFPKDTISFDSVGRKPKEESPKLDEQKSTSSNIVFLKSGILFMVAFITRWMLSFGFSVFYTQSIFVPFILIEVAMVYNKEIFFVGSQPASALTSLLMLSGVKTEVLQTYNKVSGIMTYIMEDLAIYAFVFVSVHCLVF
ncbi:unnamed protein product [Owenia fusiformis]|uniref:Calcium signal-modulating cyclophilin ligand n=1 Tax=Owenia fusiformis TaxID=6347 RepID=A0A8S4NL97_OWEFU|nr:unnamed protein product [Owenia fusiformis]